MTYNQAEWERATKFVQSAQKILVVTHVDPDGDAIGSALGITNALRLLDKEVDVAVDRGVPDYLEFLPGQDSFLSILDNGSWDLMISTDASDEARTGQVGSYGRANSDTIINLDHHVTNTGFGDIHLIVPHAVSATEIVFDWWNQLEIDCVPAIAIPLLTGLVTDTLGFRTNNVTPRTLQIAQRLIERGASLAEIIARTLERRTWLEVQLWKRVLPTVTLTGHVTSGIIRKTDLDALEMDYFDTSNIVGFLRKVNESRIAVIFKEESDNQVKISLRSKPGYDVATVAFQLGGGGHKQAAGATVPGSVDEVFARVMPMLNDAVSRGTLEID